jgi:choline-glycine betaine transporter
MIMMCGRDVFELAAKLKRTTQFNTNTQQRFIVFLHLQSEDRLIAVQSITIWAITAVATASVISGLEVGVRLLSVVAFSLGMLLLFLVFVMDNTKHFMNLIVQETGYFLQYNIFELNFWTDAYAQLQPGEGRATDGLAGATWYMDAWIIFYQVCL